MKKSKQSDYFFTERIRFEDFANQLEKSILEQSNLWEGMRHSLTAMKSIAESNGSVYFLHRVQKLSAITEKLHFKKSYKESEFQEIHKLLTKINSADKVEFLDSALKNQIKKVALGLSKDLKVQSSPDYDYYISFLLEGMHFLIPRFPFRQIPETPAYLPIAKIAQREIKLFPGPGFAGTSPPSKSKLKKKILLLFMDKSNWEGFYFDELEEEWSVEPGSLETLIDVKDRPHKKIWGSLKKKGKKYYLLKVGD